ncbi:hypothetical protein IAT38_000399 [Cryptococcus sp. DSM 104549]
MPPQRSKKDSTEEAAPRPSGSDSWRNLTSSGVPRITSRTADGTGLACQRCHRRKKKCDKGKPACKSCHSAQADCVYDIVISDRSHPNFISDLMKESAIQKDRVAWLEKSLGSMLGTDVSTISTGTSIGSSTASFGSTSPSIAPPPPTALPSSSSSSITPQAPTFAERIVRQVLTTEINRQDREFSLRATISERLGACAEDDADNDEQEPKQAELVAWPPQALAVKLLDLYFGNVGGFWPILDRAEVENDLATIYNMTAPDPPSSTTIPGPDVRVYRLFMIFAIGCNLLEQRGYRMRHDTSVLRTYAFQHFPAVLRGDELLCLYGIFHFAIYCILDFAQMNPYNVVRIAAGLAMELRMHEDDPSLPFEVQENRRRLFWSVITVDRLVSSTLMKPLAIPDSIITTSLPSTSSIEFFRHIVLLRRLDGIVLHEVYLFPARDADPDITLTRIRNEIDSWNDSIPVSTSNRGYWPLELGYHQLICKLYRPSPLFAHTHPSRMTTLRRSSYRVIEMYRSLQAEQRVPQNYVHLHMIITASVALIYTLLESEGDPQNLHLAAWRRQALQEVGNCEELLGNFAVCWPGVSKFREAFSHLADDVKVRLRDSVQPTTAAQWAAPPPAQVVGPTNTEELPVYPTLPEFSPTWAWDMASWDEAWMMPDVEVQEVTPDAALHMNSVSGMGIDELLLSIGLGGFGDVDSMSSS